MDKVRLYHVGDNGLQEGEELGRISVVLKADYEIEAVKLKAQLTKALALIWEMYLGDPSDETCNQIEVMLNHPLAPSATTVPVEDSFRQDAETPGMNF